MGMMRLSFTPSADQRILSPWGAVGTLSQAAFTQGAIQRCLVPVVFEAWPISSLRIPASCIVLDC